MGIASRTTVMGLLLGILLISLPGSAQAQVRPEVDPALKHYDKNGSHDACAAKLDWGYLALACMLAG
jgi:hypothetical protein